MTSVRVLRVPWLIAVAASVAACGFDARPKSGAVACKPQGAACCPEGYVCVGRGTSTDGGVSPGTCWYKEDLPLPARATMHDHTPALANDPACLVTDWLPPVPGTGGAGGQPDGGGLDIGGLPSVDTGGSGGGLDSGADAPLGPDAARDVWLGTGGTGGSPDAPAVDNRGVSVDTGSEVWLPGLLDGAAEAARPIDALPMDRAPADGTADRPLPPFTDGAADVPISLDGALDVAAEVPGAPDVPPDLSVAGGEVGAVDSGLGLLITSIAAGFGHTCAVVGGEARCWGRNYEGQLGDGTTSNKTIPQQVAGLAAGVTVVAAGSEHTCAVVNGGVRCWGRNEWSQLGDNSTVLRRTGPVQVVGLGSGVTALAATHEHTCALVNNGVRCWGRNSNYQLGDGTTSDRNIPVQVVGLESGVTAIAAGANHSCAVVYGGARCWGGNDVGQLGDNTSTNRQTPVPVVGLDTGVTAIAAGSHFACAIVDGVARCWGSNTNGKLGYGSNGFDKPTPVQVQGLTANVTAIATNSSHSCAVVNGAAKCWGSNYSCKLGDCSVTDGSPSPVQVIGLASGVLGITTGVNHSCAWLADGMRCWGINADGQLGDGTSGSDSNPPVQVRFP
jgi:alpha-tubulin suppressor-like RCC1 family protein